MKPRIAIPTPTSADVAYNRLNWEAYADAILFSGGEPVRCELDLSRRETLALIDGCKGVVLPGSPADVSPEKYGQTRQEVSASADVPREVLDEILLEAVELSGKPMLAICYGMQILNVNRGGTLIQDVTVLPVNHAAGRGVAVAHTAAFHTDALIAEMVDVSEARAAGAERRVPVNSSHHQAVGIVGTGLKVSARCPQDGVVEAIELVEPGGRFLVGVQWHPERTLETSSTSRSIFARFIHEASSWRPTSQLAEL